MNATEDNTGSESITRPFNLNLDGRLRRLKINQFRTIEPGTEIRFDDGINVLLGRNGTGKTTLLELISAICRGALGSYEKEEFDLEYDLNFGDLGSSLHVRNTASKEETSGLGLDRSGKDLSWSYLISFSYKGESAVDLESRSGASTVTWAGTGDSRELAEAPLFIEGFTLLAAERCIQGAQDPSLLDILKALQPLMVGHAFVALSCMRLDEGLDVFRSVTGLPSHSSVYTQLNLFSDVVSTDPRDVIQRAFRQYYVPLSLREYALSDPFTDNRHNEITFHGDRIPFLKTMASVLGAEDVQLTMLLVQRTVERGITYSTFDRPVFRITKGDTTFTHDRLSYGEKRLLAFLYHAAVNTDILVADELVNGLHYEWIGACLDAIKGQAFLSSQNPLLLDHLPFTSAEEAERRFILCSTDDDGTWTWRNMTPDEASTFFRAYEVGVQHVSSILRTKGLW